MWSNFGAQHAGGVRSPFRLNWWIFNRVAVYYGYVALKRAAADTDGWIQRKYVKNLLYSRRLLTFGVTGHGTEKESTGNSPTWWKHCWILTALDNWNGGSLRRTVLRTAVSVFYYTNSYRLSWLTPAIMQTQKCSYYTQLSRFITQVEYLIFVYKQRSV